MIPQEKAMTRLSTPREGYIGASPWRVVHLYPDCPRLGGQRGVPNHLPSTRPVCRDCIRREGRPVIGIDVTRCERVIYGSRTDGRRCMRRAVLVTAGGEWLCRQHAAGADARTRRGEPPPWPPTEKEIAAKRAAIAKARQITHHAAEVARRVQIEYNRQPETSWHVERMTPGEWERPGTIILGLIPDTGAQGRLDVTRAIIDQSGEGDEREAARIRILGPQPGDLRAGAAYAWARLLDAAAVEAARLDDAAGIVHSVPKEVPA